MSSKDIVLSDKQHQFLEALRDKERNPTGCVYKAGALVGITPNNVYGMLKNLKDKLIEDAELELAALLPKAVRVIDNAMDNPDRNTQSRLAGASNVFDRVGVVKKEKAQVNIQATNALFILPAKLPDNN